MKNSNSLNAGLAVSFTIGFWLAFNGIAIGIALGLTISLILKGLHSARNKEMSNAD